MEKGGALGVPELAGDAGQKAVDSGAGAFAATDGWPPPFPPWAGPQAWQAVTAALAHHLVLPHFRACPALRRKAIAVRHLIECLDPPMDELARHTCVDCVDPCCVRATLWYDTVDLLVMGLFQSPWPEGQPMAAAGETCRYLGPVGCRLPRPRRPWICTWYLCPRQTARLDAAHGRLRRRIYARRRGVKQLRKGIERDFIALAWGKPEGPGADGAPDGFNSKWA
jgi:hypothetical protein